MGAESEMTSARPWATSIIAKVAMKGGILNNDTLPPLMNPMKPPKRIANKTPSATGKPMLTMKTPDMTPHSAMPVPMERSIPPVMMTNVVPSASIPMATVENRMLVTLEYVKNDEFATEK